MGIPLKSKLVVKARQVLSIALELNSELESFVSEELLEQIRAALPSDGAYILFEVLGYRQEEEHTAEHILALVWRLAYTPGFSLSPLGLVECWKDLEEETQRAYLALIHREGHRETKLESLSLLAECRHLAAYGRIRDLVSEALILYLRVLIKADDFISDAEEEAESILRGAIDESENSKRIVPSLINSPTDSLSETLDKIESLIGLSNIKIDIQRLAKFVQVNQLRVARGMPAVPVSLHSVFSGPPGTGKTTVARLYARLLYDLGILRKGHLIEADRSMLVGGYVGQTAIKVMEILKQAIDGVLFIDEAYTLKSDDGYGQEAIDTILKFMEDNRDRLVVIVAGYEKKMQDFIRSNPGLESRFSRYFYFPSYNSFELVQIFESLCNESGFVIEQDFRDMLREKLDMRKGEEDEFFGNARFVRNAFELTVQNQFARLGVTEEVSVESMQLLTLVDLAV
jgi:stage V sporulation protein K